MYEQQDHDFFDVLYQQWTKTTDAESSYWVVEEDKDHYAFGPGTFNVWAVDANNPDAPRKFIASFEREEDADFTAGINGAIPDLIRRLHEAIDEAVRKDEANDIAQGQLADALLENIGIRAEMHDLEVALAEANDRLEDEGNR
ncbi:hypothetical protein REDROCK_41 [Mycobacterium phage RedRock]|uniref:Uncharacterized protein n=1 Tax=Mycobacterium phage RedRock TaxID=711470 RepID=D3JZA3_9CAUD|nr:hypothetical protein REDROCK_41 [Mycobacterium phage RedRock]ADB93734.1 hypothetical protein REDROCK_41 [Mycobacterium phage RedRock]